jgi:hypothetical protein
MLRSQSRAASAAFFLSSAEIEPRGIDIPAALARAIVVGSSRFTGFTSFLRIHSTASSTAFFLSTKLSFPLGKRNPGKIGQGTNSGFVQIFQVGCVMSEPLRCVVGRLFFFGRCHRTSRYGDPGSIRKSSYNRLVKVMKEDKPSCPTIRKESIK